MTVTTFPRLFLIVAIVCHVVTQAQYKKSEHKLKYKTDDRRPHFGYTKGHMASDHKKRYKATTKASGTDLDPLEHLALNDFIARLYNKDEMICSGLVVSNRTVLTASSCISDVALELIEVRLMDNTTRKVANVSDAGEYVHETALEHVSLLILDKALPKKYRKSPSICPIHVGQSQSVDILSWDKHKTHLLNSEVRQFGESECKLLINDIEGRVINGGISCVDNPRLTRECEKSHGLPYMWKGIFCGLNLFGHKCRTNSSADVYARLLTVKPYISRKLKEVKLSRLEDELD